MTNEQLTQILITAIIISIVLIISGLFVMIFWNLSIAEIFKLGPIKYYQAIGLYALCHMLFSNKSEPNDN